MSADAACAASVNDVHERIRKEADELSALRAPSSSDIDGRPALSGLMAAVMESIEAALPSHIDYKGQRYWIRVRVIADVGIHATPSSMLPMVRSFYEGRWAGHKPGH